MCQSVNVHLLSLFLSYDMYSNKLTVVLSRRTTCRSKHVLYNSNVQFSESHLSSALNGDMFRLSVVHLVV